VGLIIFLLPESLSKEEMIANGKKKNHINLKDMWTALFTPIGILLVVSFLMSFSLTNLETVFSLYSVERYGFDTREVGITLMFAGVIYAVVPAVLTGPLTNRFGDTAILKASLIASGVGFFLLLLPNTMIGVFLAGLIFVSGNALLRPTSVSLLSKRTTLGQGVTMGLTNSFNSLGRIVGPFWAGLFFDLNINLPYINGGVFMIIGFILSLIWLKPGGRYVVVED
jgi:DHA1 family multidrug resistance protein-like MFS transporter